MEKAHHATGEYGWAFGCEATTLRDKESPTPKGIKGVGAVARGPLGERLPERVVPTDYPQVWADARHELVTMRACQGWLCARSAG